MRADEFAVPGEICVRIAQPVRYSATEDPQHIAADLERRVKRAVACRREVASRYGEQCILGSTRALSCRAFSQSQQAHESAPRTKHASIISE